MIHSPNFPQWQSSNLAFDSHVEPHCLVLRTKLSETIPLRRRVVLRLNHWCVPTINHRGWSPNFSSLSTKAHRSSFAAPDP
jgi:hypothetical protein